MQIQKLNSISGINKRAVKSWENEERSNISFGYNPVVNAELLTTLENSKKNKAFINYLKEMVYLTNKAEDDLRDAEKKNKKVLYGLLAMTFVPVKIVLTNLIDTMFPDLKYRQSEMEAYSDEVYEENLEKTNPDHWLNELANAFQEQEAQEQAEVAAHVITSIFSERFPYVKLDMDNLTDELKKKYINDIADEDGYEVEESEAEDSVFIPQPNVTDKKDDVKDLKARIELGKNSVFLYEPKTKSEKMGFASLGGMKELKETLMKKIVTPLRDLKQARYNEEHYGIKMPNGILFYGPPGTGKTTIIKRLAVEAGLPLLRLTGDSYSSQWVGQTEQNLGAVFDYAASIATEEKPVILLIDDVDGIAGKRHGDMSERDKKLMQILLDRTQDALKDNVIVMAATNCYDNVDPAFSSRLRTQIYLGLQDEEGRKSIIELLLNETDNGKKLASDKDAVNRITKLTEGFPTRAIEDFVNDVREKAQIDFYHTRDMELSDFEEIIAKPENQNKKVKEDQYKTKATRKTIGFNSSSTIVGGPKTIG